MYIKRHAEATVRRLAKMFGAVLVAGPRQVGKTTMLERVASGIRRVSMDDAILRASAEERTHTFFLDNPPPVFVDEIQKAPLLFEEIKLWLDKERKKGQFYMCGSQQFRMMKGVSESLAGRIGLITLLGLSIRERKGVSFDSPFTPTDEYLKAREKELVPIPYSEVWDMVHRGRMPELVDNEDFDWRLFYGSYVSTYIERDVRELSEIGDEVKFSKFMVALASSIGQLLNLASLARDVGISLPTAERWMSILVASNLVYLLRPYSSNLLKRAVKTPKVYFLDTGLAAYLTKKRAEEKHYNVALSMRRRNWSGCYLLWRNPERLTVCLPNIISDKQLEPARAFVLQYLFEPSVLLPPCFFRVNNS